MVLRSRVWNTDAANRGSGPYRLCVPDSGAGGAYLYHSGGSSVWSAY